MRQFGYGGRGQMKIPIQNLDSLLKMEKEDHSASVTRADKTDMSKSIFNSPKKLKKFKDGKKLRHRKS